MDRDKLGGICNLQSPKSPYKDVLLFATYRQHERAAGIFVRVPRRYVSANNLRKIKWASKVPPSISGRIRPKVEMSINLPRGSAQPELGSNFWSDLNASLGLDARYPSLLSSRSSLFCSFDHLQLVVTTFSALSLFPAFPDHDIQRRGRAAAALSF